MSNKKFYKYLSTKIEIRRCTKFPDFEERHFDALAKYNERIKTNIIARIHKGSSMNSLLFKIEANY
jgi:hypothetical protein